MRLAISTSGKVETNVVPENRGNFILHALGRVGGVLSAVALNRLSTGSAGILYCWHCLPSWYAAYRAIRYFLELLRDTLRIGQSLVEISDLPLFPGERYQVFLRRGECA